MSSTAAGVSDVTMATCSVGWAGGGNVWNVTRFGVAAPSGSTVTWYACADASEPAMWIWTVAPITEYVLVT